MADTAAQSDEIRDVGNQSGAKVPMLSEEVSEKVQRWLYEKLFVPSKDYREKVANDAEWGDWRDMYAGEFSKWDNTDSDFEPFHANIIMPVIDTVKGIALQTPSVVEFVPTEQSDEQFAMELSAIIGEYLWSARKARFKLGIAFTEGAIVGTAWAKGVWNGALRGHEGDIDFIIPPAEEIFVDPACTGINDWQHIIHAARRPVVEIQFDDFQYNDYRKQVQADSKADTDLEDNPEQQMDLVTVYEYWVKGMWLKALCNAVPEFESEVDEVGWNYGMQITVADKKVVKHNPHPFESDRFPFSRFVYYAPQGQQRIYGMGEPKNLKDPQLSINARATQMLEQAALIANNQYVVSNMTVLDESELNNKAGGIIHVDGTPDAIKRIEPTGISGSLFSIFQLLLELQQIIPGMFEVNRGGIPGSIRAGVAIQSLQRGGEGRTQQKTANFDEFVADLGLIMADIMATMYTSERTFRIVGSTARDIATVEAENTPPDEVEPTFTETGIQEPEMPQEQRVADISGQVRSTEVKISSESFKKDGKRVDLDVRAMVSMMRKSPDEMLQANIELVKEGIADAQYVIEQSLLPGKERLLTRLFSTVEQNQGAPTEDAPLPEQETPTGTDSEFTDSDMEQMSAAIEDTLNQLRTLESQGTIPRGFSAQVEASIAQEIQQGGTGEQTLAAALQAVQEMMAGQDPGIPAGAMDNTGMMPEGQPPVADMGMPL